MRKKLDGAGHVMGDDSAVEKTPCVETCCACGFKGEEVKRCGHCKATSYCSLGCQMSHRDYHKAYCSAIASLEKLEKEKLYRNFSVRQCQVDFRTKKKLVRLVGEKPVLSCNLGAKKTKVLWDTGSMVSLVDRKWLALNFPHAEILSVADFLEEKLEVKAANSTSIDLDGVVVLDFSLGEDGETFTVPFVVTSQDLVEPILGYNVIEHLVLEGNREQRNQLGISLGCQGCPLLPSQLSFLSHLSRLIGQHWRIGSRTTTSPVFSTIALISKYHSCLAPLSAFTLTRVPNCLRIIGQFQYHCTSRTRSMRTYFPMSRKGCVGI